MRTWATVRFQRSRYSASASRLSKRRPFKALDFTYPPLLSATPFSSGWRGLDGNGTKPQCVANAAYTSLTSGSYRQARTTAAFRLSWFCSRPDYVAGVRSATWSPVRTGESGHVTNQSDASQLRRVSSVLQIGLVWEASVVSESSVARSAASLVFVLISA